MVGPSKLSPSDRESPRDERSSSSSSDSLSESAGIKLGGGSGGRLVALEIRPERRREKGKEILDQIHDIKS